MGEGGFGITYKVLHNNLRAYLVIKTLNNEKRDDLNYDKYEKRFLKEGRTLEQLSQQENKNIVRVTDLFVKYLANKKSSAILNSYPKT